MGSPHPSPHGPATGPQTQHGSPRLLLCLLLMLRILDLRLADQRDEHPLRLGLLASICATALVLGAAAGLSWWREIPPERRASRIFALASKICSLCLLCAIPMSLIRLGTPAQALAMRSLLESVIALLAGTWCLQRAYEASRNKQIPRALLGVVQVFTACTIALHVAERVWGQPLLEVAGRAALQGLGVSAVLLVLAWFALGQTRASAKLSLGLLALPLLARLVLVGRWTALLGVAVPEERTGWMLSLWSVCGLGLTILNLPRAPWPRQIVPGLAATVLALLPYLHYSQRFGRIEAQFDALSLALLGVFLPYPQWQAPAASAAFSVSTLFVIFLVLRCAAHPATQRLALGLGLWFSAGIGLDRSASVLALLVAAWLLATALGDSKT